MLSRTLYPECLVLAATVAPAELIRVATSFNKGKSKISHVLRNPSYAVSCAYVLTLGLALIVVISNHFTSGYLTAWRVSFLWLAIAIGVGCSLVGLEIVIGAAPKIMRGNHVMGFSVNAGQDQLTTGYLAAISVTGAAEEIMYRGLWIGTLTERLNVASALAIPGAAMAYALGHLFFGASVVGQKAMTGVALGMLLIASGSLLVPLVAHVAQNMTVYMLATKNHKPMKGGRHRKH
jgi:CAAX protease family protein